MKEKYEALEMETTEFDTEDVITTSGGTGDGGAQDDWGGTGNGGSQ